MREGKGFVVGCYSFWPHQDPFRRRMRSPYEVDGTKIVPEQGRNVLDLALARGKKWDPVQMRLVDVRPPQIEDREIEEERVSLGKDQASGKPAPVPSTFSAQEKGSITLGSAIIFGPKLMQGVVVVGTKTKLYAYNCLKGRKWRFEFSDGEADRYDLEGFKGGVLRRWQTEPVAFPDMQCLDVFILNGFEKISSKINILSRVQPHPEEGKFYRSNYGEIWVQEVSDYHNLASRRSVLTEDGFDILNFLADGKRLVVGLRSKKPERECVKAYAADGIPIWQDAVDLGDYGALQDLAWNTNLGIIYAALKNKILFLDLRSGEEKAAFVIENSYQIMAAQDHLFVLDSNQTLIALCASEGRELWRFSIEGSEDEIPEISLPAVLLNKVALVASNRRLYPLDLNTGKLAGEPIKIWAKKASPPVAFPGTDRFAVKYSKRRLAFYKFEIDSSD